MTSLFRPTLRSWRIYLFWLFLIILSAFVLFLEYIIDVGGSAQAPVAPTPIVEPTPHAALSPFPDRSLLTEAKVVAVIDGDTIEVEVAGQAAPLRYYGSDAPELALAPLLQLEKEEAVIVADHLAALAIGDPD